MFASRKAARHSRVCPARSARSAPAGTRWRAGDACRTIGRSGFTRAASVRTRCRGRSGEYWSGFVHDGSSSPWPAGIQPILRQLSPRCGSNRRGLQSEMGQRRAWLFVQRDLQDDARERRRQPEQGGLRCDHRLYARREWLSCRALRAPCRSRCLGKGPAAVPLILGTSAGRPRSLIIGSKTGHPRRVTLLPRDSPTAARSP